MKMSWFWRLCGVLGVIALWGGDPATMAQPAASPPEILLNRGFAPNPMQITGNSGGEIPVTRVVVQKRTPTGLCLGYISPQPNHILTLETFFNYLAITVDSLQDTTLIVQGPGGIWCNDDTQGHNPAIAGQWQPGSYHIWVGSYAMTQADDYTLLIRDADADAEEI
jgi:hypothetical protein